eukprot:776298_1
MIIFRACLCSFAPLSCAMAGSNDTILDYTALACLLIGSVCAIIGMGSMSWLLDSDLTVQVARDTTVTGDVSIGLLRWRVGSGSTESITCLGDPNCEDATGSSRFVLILFIISLLAVAIWIIIYFVQWGWAVLLKVRVFSVIRYACAWTAFGATLFGWSIFALYSKDKFEFFFRNASAENKLVSLELGGSWAGTFLASFFWCVAALSETVLQSRFP